MYDLSINIYGLAVSISVLFYIECFHSRIYCTFAKFFFDTEKLIVFGYSLGTAWCSGLDLAGVECHGKIGDRRILCLSGTMG